VILVSLLGAVVDELVDVGLGELDLGEDLVGGATDRIDGSASGRTGR
jgi:hypothetical protein